MVLVAPGVLLLAWGAVYLRSCLIVLTAPGRPILFRYKAPAGEVTLRAASFVLNVRQGSVYVVRPELDDPGGTRVASAEYLQLFNLDWRKGSDQFIDLRIHNLQGRLVRSRGGAIQLIDLIPPHARPTLKTPLQVEVDGATVMLEDQQGAPWRQYATAQRVDVAGYGQDWIAHATVSLPGMGDLQTQVQYVPDSGVHVTGSTGGLNAQAAAAHFLSTPESKRFASLRDLKVAGLTVSGPFDLFVPMSKRTVLQVYAHVTARDVAYGQYKVDRFQFDGVVTTKGAEGTASGQAGGVTATLKGTGTWSPSEVAGGLVEASAPSMSAIPQWARGWIPPHVGFTGAKYRGWVSFGKGRETEVSGTASAASADYDKVHVTGLSANAWGDRNRLRLDGLRGMVAETSAAGSLDFDLSHRTLQGWIRADSPDLAALAKIGKLSGVSGEGHVVASLNGPIRSPEVGFVATGRVAVRRIGGADLGMQSVDLAGTYANGTAVIERGWIEGGMGMLTISGKGEPSRGGITMHVDGRGLQPRFLLPGVAGSIDLTADVSGTYADPHYSGRIEGSDLVYKGQTVTAAEAEFQGDRRDVSATKIAAVSGTMDLSGAARYSIAADKLSGKLSLRGLPSTEYLGDDFAGTLDVSNIQLGGSLRNPVADAQVAARQLVAHEVVLRSLRGQVRLDLNEVMVDHATVSLAGGNVSASGNYVFQTGAGDFSASTTDLDLGRLAPALGESVAISGTASVSHAQGSLRKGSVTGTAAGSLDHVQVNGVPAGDGNWSFSSNGNQVRGTMSIGEVEPALRVLNVDVGYDLEVKTLHGSVDATKTRLKDLIGAGSRYLPASWTADTEKLQSLSGDLTLAAEVSGPANDPSLTFTSLQAQNLTYRGVAYGALDAPGTTRAQHKWSIPSLSLSGPQGGISVQGNADENGQIDLTGTVNQLHLSALSPWVAALSSSSGIADVQLTAKGATRAPDINGSATLTHVAKAPVMEGTNPQAAQDLAIQIPHFSLGESKAELAGTYAYEGFAGSFESQAPFSYQGGFGSGSATGNISVNERSITDLPFLASFLDPARTTGTIGGSISVSGPISDLVYGGGVKLQASSLGIRFTDPNAYVKRIDDTIEGLTASLELTSQHTLALTGSGKIQRGGSFTVTASAPLLDPSPIFTGSVDAVVRQFLDGPLSGRLALDKATLRQSAPGGYVAGQVDGSTVIGGTVAKPAIGTQASHGDFSISSLDTIVPRLPAGGGEGTVPVIDPSFYVDAKLSNPARVRSATADLGLNGSGSLRGVLSDPRASADLTVASGSIRLPGGTVRLVPGGTVTFQFRHPFGETPSASLNVDLQGRTSLTAIRYGGNSQRYDVVLDLRGDLLKDQGLQMEAFSSPPDLTSQEALAQLGALGYVQGLGSTQGGFSEAQARITQALAGFAVPAVTDPITSSLAKSLGLSYIQVEYNPFELTTVSIARAMTDNLSVQYRGQIGAPLTGIKPIEDWRMVYTPFQTPTLRNFSFALGADQDRFWKVAVEYGIRFGGRKGPPSTKKTRISP